MYIVRDTSFWFVVFLIQRDEQIYLKSIIEYDDIPIVREDSNPSCSSTIHTFIRLWFEIPPTDDKAELLLIGRDVPNASHLFGNSQSPAVAKYCFHSCIEEPCYSDVKYYVTKHFYIDDGLSSYDTDNEALDILLRTQKILRDRGKMKFHKFAFNSHIFMDALPAEDRVKYLSDVHLNLHTTPAQSSLGLTGSLPLNFLFLLKRPQRRNRNKSGVISW